MIKDLPESGKTIIEDDRIEAVWFFTVKMYDVRRDIKKGNSTHKVYSALITIFKSRHIHW